MRHGESKNNELRIQDEELYQNQRTYDPELSEKGTLESLNTGKTFKDLRIKIDEIRTSAFIRSLQSAKLFRESYGGKDLKIRLMVKIHEKAGCYMKGKVYPGAKLSEVKTLIPDIEIDEANSQLIDEEGWWKQAEMETNE